MFYHKIGRENNFRERYCENSLQEKLTLCNDSNRIDANKTSFPNTMSQL